VIELIVLLILAAGAWLWYDTLGAREAAMAAARSACQAEGVQLLDDTVALAVLRLRRRGDGRIAILRVYQFEFTDTGNNRLGGAVTLLGRMLQHLHLASGTASHLRLVE
jgi:hypothetical protein